MKRTILNLLTLAVGITALEGASSSQENWEHHYARSGIYPDYETRLIWQDDASVGREKMDFAQARGYCRSLSLAGHHDWRLPNVNELQRLNGSEEKMHKVSHVPSGSFWSSTLLEQDGWQYVQGVRYPGGRSGHTNPKNAMLVRCVRTGATEIGPRPAAADVSAEKRRVQAENQQKQSMKARQESAERLRRAAEAAEAERQAKLRAERKRKAEAEAARLKREQERAAQERFELLQQVALIDPESGLAWQDEQANGERRLTWSEAADYCTSLRIAGYDDWQLPTSDELETLYRHREDLKHSADTVYWTGTLIDADNGTVEYVDFGSGAQFWTTKNRAFNVRCVRHPQQTRIALIDQNSDKRKP